jgi:putative addiction module antidote
MITLRITQIGDSAALILPEEVLAKLNAKEGDDLLLLPLPDGALRLTTSDLEFQRQLEAGRKVMREHADVLRELAKR